jgi:hypothetical protein
MRARFWANLGTAGAVRAQYAVPIQASVCALAVCATTDPAGALMSCMAHSAFGFVSRRQSAELSKGWNCSNRRTALRNHIAKTIAPRTCRCNMTILPATACCSTITSTITLEVRFRLSATSQANLTLTSGFTESSSLLPHCPSIRARIARIAAVRRQLVPGAGITQVLKLQNMHTSLDTGKASPYVATVLSTSVGFLLCDMLSYLEMRVFHSSDKRVGVLALTDRVSRPSAAVHPRRKVSFRTEECHDSRAPHHHVGNRNRHNYSHTSPG